MKEKKILVNESVIKELMSTYWFSTPFRDLSTKTGISETRLYRLSDEIDAEDNELFAAE